MGTESKRQNTWEALLRQATQRQIYEDSTLIVLGNTNCGKSSILKAFPGCVKNDYHPYVADYSYMRVKNRYEVDSDETLAHMAVWQLDDPERKGLIPTFIRSTGLKRTMFMIVLDLSHPWSVYESLQTWLGVAEEVSRQLLKDMDEEDATALRNRISKYVASYVDPSLREGNEGKDLKVTGEAKTDTSIPEINMGVPVVVVGAKGDYFSSLLHKSTSASDKFEFVSRRLRQICLKYGSSLVYTSVAGEGTNVQLLQDYIFHRMYDFEMKQKAKAATTVDSFGLYIPSGYDSVELIDSVRPPKSPYDDALPFTKVFANPNKEIKRRTEEEKVKALKNSQFYRLLQTKLKSGPRTSSSKGTDSGKKSSASKSSPHVRSSRSGSKLSGSGSGSPKSNHAVRQFFQSLLTGTNAKKVSSGSASRKTEAQKLAIPDNN